MAVLPPATYMSILQEYLAYSDGAVSLSDLLTVRPAAAAPPRVDTVVPHTSCAVHFIGSSAAAARQPAKVILLYHHAWRHC